MKNRKRDRDKARKMLQGLAMESDKKKSRGWTTLGSRIAGAVFIAGGAFVSGRHLLTPSESTSLPSKPVPIAHQKQGPTSTTQELIDAAKQNDKLIRRKDRLHEFRFYDTFSLRSLPRTRLELSKGIDMDSCGLLCLNNQDCLGFSYQLKGKTCQTVKQVEIINAPSHKGPMVAAVRTLPPTKNPPSSLQCSIGFGTVTGACNKKGLHQEQEKSALQEALVASIAAITSVRVKGLAGRKISPVVQSALASAKDQLVAIENSSPSFSQAAKLTASLSLACLDLFLSTEKSLLAATTRLKLHVADQSLSPVSRVQAGRLLSYALECSLDLTKAQQVRQQALGTANDLDLPATLSNKTYDRYFALGKDQGYAVGSSKPRHYCPTLTKLHAFRQLWEQLIAQAGSEAWHLTQKNVEDLTESIDAVQDGSGFRVLGGADAAELRHARDFMNANGFVILRSLVHPWEVHMMANYFSSAVTEGVYVAPTFFCECPYIMIFKGTPIFLLSRYASHDKDLSRTSAYNDRIGYYMNSNMLPFMEQILGHAAQPSYSFLCHYEFEKGDPRRPELRPHTDRLDNSYTTSLQIYAEPENFVWPIVVDKQITVPRASAWRERPGKQRQVTATMPIGDAIFFMGRYHNHWRDPMPQHVVKFESILWHYVEADVDLKTFNTNKGKFQDNGY